MTVMLKCKTCGAECQNPLDRKGQTFIKWFGIHAFYPHELDNTKEEIKEVQDMVLKVLSK